jgi:hypothetical protein
MDANGANVYPVPERTMMDDMQAAHDKSEAATEAEHDRSESDYKAEHDKSEAEYKAAHDKSEAAAKAEHDKDKAEHDQSTQAEDDESKKAWRR